MGTEQNIILYAKWRQAATFVTNGAGTITGLTTYGQTLTDITIPSQIDGVTITTIGSGAFEGNKTLEAISLPSTVTTISQNAFRNCALKRFGSGAEITIEEGAFQYCGSLTVVEIPNAQYIGKYAFNKCSLKEFVTRGIWRINGVEIDFDNLSAAEKDKVLGGAYNEYEWIRLT